MLFLERIETRGVVLHNHTVRFLGPGKRRLGGMAGVTLVELMTVIAIIGILTTVATNSLATKDYAATVNGFAEKIAAQCDVARLRAAAQGKRQRLIFNATDVVHQESNTIGFAPAATWVDVSEMATPQYVEIYAVSNLAHTVEDSSVPDAGDGLGGIIEFTPDGRGQTMTIFIGDDTDKHRARTVIYGATGTPYVFKGW